MSRKAKPMTLSEDQLEDLATMISQKLADKFTAVDKKLEALSEVDTRITEKVDAMEQNGRLENLRIFGVEEKEDEKVEETVIEVAQKAGINLNKSSIGRTHRLGKKQSDKKRAIIVKFVSYQDRQRLYQAKKQLKGTGIAITEDLTKLRYEILKKAKENFGRE